MAKSQLDASSRIVEAYSALQTLGKRVKPSPFQYSSSAARRLEKRAAAAITEAETKLVTATRGKKTLAYNILKAKGERVKPNVSDYRSGDSLIRRATHTAYDDLFTAATPYINAGRRQFQNTAGRKGYFDTFISKGFELDPDEALRIAQRIIDGEGARYDRAQVVLGGLLRPYFDTSGREIEFLSESFISGPQSVPGAAVAAYRPYQERFEYVSTVKVIFKKNPK